MKAILLATVPILLPAAPLMAAELPALYDKPFIGCFVGFSEARDFQFAIGADGSSELYFMEGRDQRLTTTGTTLKIYYVLEERAAGKEKWTSRRMAEDGFETAHKATMSPALDKPITFTATYTGDTKVEISHLFTKDGVEITTKVVEKKTENEVRTGVKVLVGDMYRHLREEFTERELKAKIKDGRLEVWPRGSDKSSGEKIDLHELDVKLPEAFPKGASRFSLKSDRIADHEYTITTANEKFGVIEFLQTRELYHGFYLTWWPDPAKSAEKDCRMVITVD